MTSKSTEMSVDAGELRRLADAYAEVRPGQLVYVTRRDALANYLFNRALSIASALEELERVRGELEAWKSSHNERIHELRDENAALARRFVEANTTAANWANRARVLEVERDAARRELTALRAYADECARAIGIEYKIWTAADGHATVRGPLHAVVRHIKDAVRDAGEVAELRKDKERLDWLDRHCMPEDIYGGSEGKWVIWNGRGTESDDLRMAIDGAMAEDDAALLSTTPEGEKS